MFCRLVKSVVKAVVKMVANEGYPRPQHTQKGFRARNQPYTVNPEHSTVGGPEKDTKKGY